MAKKTTPPVIWTWVTGSGPYAVGSDRDWDQRMTDNEYEGFWDLDAYGRGDNND